ncbi:tRNA-dihydrouridine synthase [Candidatus Saccharibacteria bacterium]|nr:MAG: tRNA-dihydrouridine synthase [Candidatus Saccharibacteria bacterium]
MNNFWDKLPRPFFALAPMEAVTDVVFRQVVAKAAAPDVWFSEFTNATGWVHAGQKAIGGRLVKTDAEHPIVAQIWGGEPGDMEQLAAHCAELGFDGIGINMGCPAKSAIKSGGSALIRQPELAAESIASAKTASLPVSVKTRLGYTRVDEWRDWLAHLLHQDIVNLTIHLRTKKEMSKVPAHFELIDDIIALRDEIAPQTLLTINGDIKNRAHGEELVAKHPGIDGIMIGRGIFHDPFCFADNSCADSTNPSETTFSSSSLEEHRYPQAGSPELTRATERPSRPEDSTSFSEGSAFPAEASQERQLDQIAASRPEEKDGCEVEVGLGNEGERGNKEDQHKQQLLQLLSYHLELYEQWHEQTGRPYETLKRFFKIYVRDFDGAKDMRDQLMHTKSTDEVRQLIK